MSRLAFTIVILIALLLASIWAVNAMKQSYKILPIQEAKQVSNVPFSDWYNFKSPSGKFSVKVPVLPQHASQNVVDPKTKQTRHYDMYVSQKEDGTIFMVSLIKFPDGTKEAPDLIEKSIVNDMLASNPQNQLKNMQMGDFQGFKALDFSIENATMILLGRVFMDGSTLYLLSAIFNSKDAETKDYNYFIDSFNLTAEVPAAASVPAK